MAPGRNPNTPASPSALCLVLGQQHLLARSAMQVKRHQRPIGAVRALDHLNRNAGKGAPQRSSNTDRVQPLGATGHTITARPDRLDSHPLGPQRLNLLINARSADRQRSRQIRATMKLTVGEQIQKWCHQAP